MKKLLAIIISTLLALTLFASCKANKADNTLTPNPPTGTTAKVEEEKIETTVKEVVPETEKKEEIKTTLPETTVKKENPTQAPTTKAPEAKPQQNPAPTTENRTKAPTVTQAILNITKDEAKEIALGHAGLTETDIRYYKSELDRERKTIVYEIEFDSGKFEYDYEIDANSGKVIKAEKDFND